MPLKDGNTAPDKIIIGATEEVDKIIIGATETSYTKTPADTRTLLATQVLTIGANGAQNRIGRGRGGGFGSWDADPTWRNAANTADQRVDNFQTFYASPTQHFAEMANGNEPADQIEITVGSDMMLWTLTGDPRGGTNFYTQTGTEVFTVANIGQEATCKFYRE